MKILILLLSYLIGSIPNAFIVSKLIKKIDISKVGEGNVGARNVWHVISPFWGVFVFFLDFLKGFTAFLISIYFLKNENLIWLSGFLCVFGHGFPIFLKFRGGKGLATATGFLFGKFPEITLIGILIYLIVFLISKNFHISVTISIILTILFIFPLFKKSLIEILNTTIFLLWLGFKRLIDEPYMRKVKLSNSYWK
jgi:glycerol-3-phosphate acyltransferase PlsY